jgi:hypothetical protein
MKGILVPAFRTTLERTTKATIKIWKEQETFPK